MMHETYTHGQMDVEDSHPIDSPAMVSFSPRSTWQSFPGPDVPLQGFELLCNGDE